MQQRKFFIRRFRQYLIMLLIPVVIVMTLVLCISARSLANSLQENGYDTVNAVNSDVDLSLNSILLQNSQFANNPYMLLSLRKLFQNKGAREYQDAMNLRALNASLKSMSSTYEYINDILLYLDDYDYCYSSEGGIKRADENNLWYRGYQAMPKNDTTLAMLLPSDENRDGPTTLTLYQRIPFYSGVVVMNVNVEKFRRQLNNMMTLSNGDLVIFMSRGNQTLFTWGERTNDVVHIEVSRLPELDGKGSWLTIGNGRYLVHQTMNESYNIRIVSMIPEKRLEELIGIYVPFLLVILLSAIAAVFVSAYITTRRNFGYINHIVRVLSYAEKGSYPERENKKAIQDEYDVILNNIINLHLKTEKLNNELAERRHVQEVLALTTLQAQINPHFMFNTLQMIELEAAKSGSNAIKLQRMISDLADILKYALADATKTIPLRDEITYLKEYVDIQKMRFGDHFIIYYEVEDELENFPVFPLMLQPLIENSISHGVRYRNDRGYIKLTVFRKRNQDKVLFRVFDTGTGMSTEKLNAVRENIKSFNVRNIGLANVNMRLRLYFGEEACLKIRSVKEKGTIVEFELPV